MGKLIPAESECKSTFLGGETCAEEPGAPSVLETLWTMERNARPSSGRRKLRRCRQ